jgi:spore maturation protein CgeB
MKLVVFGLSLSSSWGNGHATTYRGLLKAFAARGHDIVFYERDVPWYAASRDLADPDYCRLRLYNTLDELGSIPALLEGADAVMIGSFVQEGPELIRRIAAAEPSLLAFYDIDTPVTVSRLERGDREYVTRELVPAFDLYFSFSGGPIMDRLQRDFGARDVRFLGCNADAEVYAPQPGAAQDFDLGYLGTYDASRQPALERLLIEPARRLPSRRFIVAGPQYPATIRWPDNVTRLDHLPPDAHARFYSSLRFALNVTRADMVKAGFSPSVRIFEAAACGAPVVTDNWAGLDSYFEPGREIIVANRTADMIRLLTDDRVDRKGIGQAGRSRVLAGHSAAKRAEELEAHLTSFAGRRFQEARRIAS